MTRDIVAKDCWIVGQLAGIRMLEQELTGAFKKPGARATEHLRQRLNELNCWVDHVEDALTVAPFNEKAAG